MNRFKSIGIALGLGLAACGGPDGTGSTAPGTGSTTHTLAAQQGAAATVITTGSRSGTVEVTADWTVAGNDVDVFVAQGDCFDIPTALSVWSCLSEGQATGTAKPQRLSFAAAPSTVYRVFVVNNGTVDDRVTVTVNIR
jgi:hypothetical protein